MAYTEKDRQKYAAKRIELGKSPAFQFQTLFSEGLKKCNLCSNIKTLDNFSKCKHTKHGYRSSCKQCDAEKNKEYEKNNRDKINEKRRIRRKDPKRSIILSQRDRQRALFKQKGKNKTQKTTELIRKWLGCTVEECKIYIESLFLKDMSWENRGVGEDKWQIDHIIPISLTELNEKGEIIDNDFNKKIWHYTNLQPLWHSDNSKKSNKYNHGSSNITKNSTITSSC